VDDREDFTAFVEQRQAQLLRLTRALTGDEQLGEDLAQSTLYRLWARWSRVSASGDPWPYAQRIAVSLASTWRRRRWRGEIASGAIPESAHVAGDDHSVTRATVAQWLSTLTRRQRAVIVLRFLADRSVVETADVLGCSPGTVKRQTAAALRHLRARVESDRLSEEQMS
jgi:RNA polymerase sigma-70 factor (sigma-E family)